MANLKHSKPLKEDEINQILQSAPETAFIFCADGAVVEIPYRKALEKWGTSIFAVNPLVINKIRNQNKKVNFQTSLISQMLLKEI